MPTVAPSSFTELSEIQATPTKTYRVKEIFPTVQGEGFHAGRSAVFVRTVGCNMWTGYESDRARDAARHGNVCARFCDTDFTKEGSRDMTAPQIVAACRAAGADDCRFIVLTGGEPTLQVDASLVAWMQGEGWFVSMETNGTMPLTHAFGEAAADGFGWLPNWITVSPKLTDERTIVEFCHEVKLVAPGYTPADYPGLVERCRETLPPGLKPDGHRKALYIQPEDGPRFDEAARRCIEAARAFPAFEARTQAHKTLGVD